MEETLRESPGASVELRGIRDRRVAGAVEATRRLGDSDDPSAVVNAGELRAACADAGVSAEDPDALLALARLLGVSCSRDGLTADGVYHAVFNPRFRSDSTEEQPIEPRSKSFYRPYANAPSRRLESAELSRALQDHLRQWLPEYMVPSLIQVLPSWPLLPNGKIDRRALPTARRQNETGRSPRTDQERILCDLIAELLSLSRVAIDDNFFTLGGDSIVSIQLVSRARRAGLALSPRDIFEQPTIVTLAQVARDSAPRPTPAPAVALGDLPATPIMHRLFERGGPIDRFHQSMWLPLPAQLEESDLRASLHALRETHDALRMCRERDPDGNFRLWIPPFDLARKQEILHRVDLAGKDEIARRNAMTAAARAAVDRLDPAAGSLLRAVLFAEAPKPGRLLLVIHHLAVDGVSWRILVPDLETAWDAAPSR